MTRRIIATAAFVAMIFVSATAAAGYRGELNRATKRGSIFTFDDFSARVIWNATFFSDKFRQAFKKRHLKISHLDELEAAKFIAEQEYRQSNGWDFFIGYYIKEGYKELSPDPESFWKIEIIAKNGEHIKPISIEKIQITPYEEIMYPYLNRWSKAYRVTFPKVELGRRFELFLHSAAGESTLKWKMR